MPWRGAVGRLSGILVAAVVLAGVELYWGWCFVFRHQLQGRGFMNELVERFCRYARIDTQADETSPTAPSTAKQLELSRMLAEECCELGLRDVSLSPHGVVLATIPATVSHEAPTIAWVAHVDTSPEYSGTNVKPTLHENYDGRDLVLPGDASKVLRVAENPELRELLGATIITSDGTTLLGADDKSGVAVMMTAAAELMRDPDLPHGPIRLCFTVDEEIGRGIEHLDVRQLNAICGYTLDSDGHGRIDSETFSANQAVVTVRGVNTHPSVGKGEMVNAIRILSAFLDRLPQQTLSPETTDGRAGFLHPYHVEGGGGMFGAHYFARFRNGTVGPAGGVAGVDRDRLAGGVSARGHSHCHPGAVSQHARRLAEGTAGLAVGDRGDAGGRVGAARGHYSRGYGWFAVDGGRAAHAESVFGPA